MILQSLTRSNKSLLRGLSIILFQMIRLGKEEGVENRVQKAYLRVADYQVHSVD